MINTVLGQKEKTDFGNVLMHEHIRVASNDLINTFGSRWLDDKKLIDYSAKILIELRDKYNIGLWVDATPIDTGRNTRVLKAVSEKSGVDIVASTGLYYFPDLFTCERSDEDIAKWFIYEYENGMEGTGIKPGILKCAVDRGGITQDMKKRISALGITQRETGLPLYAHCMHDGNSANELLDILLEISNEPHKIILGHTANRPDAEYLESILDRGCYICMDQCHCADFAIEDICKTLVKLCDNGYRDKILLSNDLCIYNDFAVKSGMDLSIDNQTARFGHIFEVVYKGFCEAGGSDADWNIMMNENSIDVLDT